MTAPPRRSSCSIKDAINLFKKNDSEKFRKFRKDGADRRVKAEAEKVGELRGGGRDGGRAGEDGLG